MFESSLRVRPARLPRFACVPPTDELLQLSRRVNKEGQAIDGDYDERGAVSDVKRKSGVVHVLNRIERGGVIRRIDERVALQISSSMGLC